MLVLDVLTAIAISFRTTLPLEWSREYDKQRY